MNQKDRIERVQEGLLEWFEAGRRELPWRGAEDPYAIWVSEIMLQQTQVETVKDYYARWMDQFPTLQTLAEAPLDKVLKAWEGLGYYARARNLHKAARIVADEHDGRLPRRVPALVQLPGIGRYTAGAIASLAWNLDEPVLDTNVTRVLCRLFRVRSDPKKSATRKRLWRLAERLLPPGRAREWNQAVMDFGATLCVPRAPRCVECPVEAACLGREHNEESRLPRVPARRHTPHYDIGAGIVWGDDRILIGRRPTEGLLGGLWEFPGGKREPNESLEECVVREVREELGVRADIQRPFLSVDHAYTHFRITLHTFECRYVSGEPRALGCTDWAWASVSELDDYAFPRANRRIIEALHRFYSAEGAQDGLG